MGSHDDPNPRPAHLPAWWEAQWAAVPDAWRRPVYRIDAAPANSVFLQNRYYLREHRGSAEHNFSPPAPAPARFADEVAWWVWLCHHEGLRKIEPSLLKWAGQALAAAAADYRTQHGWTPPSISDLSAENVVRQAVIAFELRNARLPSVGARRNITHLIEHLHLYLSGAAPTPRGGPTTSGICAPIPESRSASTNLATTSR
jgi:hypothetical protein